MLDAVLDLVLPRECSGCRSPGRLLCPACRALLERCAPRLTCPDPCPLGLPPLAAATTYDGAVRQLLVAHKDRGQLALARPLGVALAAAVLVHRPGLRELDGPLLLCPVPSAARVVRTRGHDHARRPCRRPRLVSSQRMGTRPGRSRCCARLARCSSRPA